MGNVMSCVHTNVSVASRTVSRRLASLWKFSVIEVYASVLALAVRSPSQVSCSDHESLWQSWRWKWSSGGVVDYCVCNLVTRMAGPAHVDFHAAC